MSRVRYAASALCVGFSFERILLGIIHFFVWVSRLKEFYLASYTFLNEAGGVWL